MERKIPLKNYIILLVIAVLFVFLVFYMRNWYNTTKVYYNGGSFVLDVSTKINQEELNNFALENPNFILYVSYGFNDDIKKFEKEMKKTIVKKNINNIVYLDASGIDTKMFNDYLIKNFISNKTEVKNVKKDSNVSIYVFNNGNISHVVNKADERGADNVEKLLEKYGLIEND